MQVAIGIMVHNEEKNIGKLLKSILKQRLSTVIIDRIIVVSSGSTDKTNEIVMDYAEKTQKIKLLNQKRREGKASAINEFLKHSKNDILIVSSGDVIFAEDTVENLVKPFRDEKVGLTSVNPIPINPKSNLIGFMVHIHWKLHNLLNRHGEAIAFRRKIVKKLPRNVVADEAYIEAKVCKSNLKAVHVSNAVVFNKGPENLADYIKQVRRHFFGHLQIINMFGYTVSSLKLEGLKKVLVKLTDFSIKNPLKSYYCLVYVFVETLARFLGLLDFIFNRKNMVLWDIAASTKDLSVPF